MSHILTFIVTALSSQLLAFSLHAVTEGWYRRQPPDAPHPPGPPPGTTESLDSLIEKMNNKSESGGADGSANRYSVDVTTVTKKKRTTPFRVSLEEECDYLAYYCLKAYKTGRICGRTLYYNYYNFSNYCMLDYVNCMENYEVWQIAHMGDCFEIKILSDYQHYEYHDDLFLDQIYVIQE